MERPVARVRRGPVATESAVRFEPRIQRGSAGADISAHAERRALTTTKCSESGWTV
jgi:hypothetical protein